MESNFTLEPGNIFLLMKMLREQMDMYEQTGGVHTSALADAENLIVVTEDVGRHNTIDKIQGECLLRGLTTKDRILLSTGRISSEMMLKAGKNAGAHCRVKAYAYWERRVSGPPNWALRW